MKTSNQQHLSSTIVNYLFLVAKKKNKQTNKKTFRYLARNFRITAKLYQKIYHILKRNIYCSFNLKLGGLSKVNEIRNWKHTSLSWLILCSSIFRISVAAFLRDECSAIPISPILLMVF